MNTLNWTGIWTHLSDFLFLSHYPLQPLHNQSYCNWYSQAVTGLGSEQAQCCLPSVIVHEPVFQCKVAVSCYFLSELFCLSLFLKYFPSQRELFNSVLWNKSEIQEEGMVKLGGTIVISAERGEELQEICLLQEMNSVYWNIMNSHILLLMHSISHKWTFC